MLRRASPVLVASVVLAALALAAHGLRGLQWPQALPTDGDALTGYARFLAGATVLVGVLALALRWRAWVCVAVLALAGTVLSGNAMAALAVLLVLAASGVAGRAFLTVLRARRAAADWTCCVLAGAGLYGSVIGLLASRPVHYVWTYVPLLVLPVLLGRSWLAEALVQARAQALRPRGTSLLSVLADALIGGIALVHVAIALLPELGSDALALHLFVPMQLATRHAWGFDVATYVWAVMPMLADWIYAMGAMLAGEPAARLVNAGFLALVVLLVRELVRWAGGAAREQRAATLLLLSIPLTFTLSSSLFVELVWTAFVLAGLLAVLRLATGDGEADEALAAGAFLGFALAAKAVTLTILPVLALCLLPRARALLARDTLRSIGLGSILVALLGGFAYVNAWRRTGNPVFPFFNGVFRSPYYPPENFESASAFSRGLHWDFPYQVIFQPQRFMEGMTGSGGFHWLLLLPAAALALLLARHKRPLALLLVALATMAVAFASVAYLRYVFPAFAIACAAAAGAFTGARAVRAALGVALMAAVSLNLLFLASASMYRDFAFGALADRGARQDWLELRLPMRRAVSVVNEINQGAPVAVIGPPLFGDLGSDALVPNWYNFGFERLLRSSRTESELVDALQARGVEYLLVDASWPDLQEAREKLTAATEPVATFGPVSLRRWAKAYLFRHELLANPHFEGPQGWSFGGDAPRAGGPLVTVSSPAFQAVPVQPGLRYLNAVTVTCAESAQARLQVNWMSKAGVFLKADIRVVDCGPQPSAHQMEVAAPAGAAVATVYASAHGQGRVQFLENSFRR